MLSASFRVYLSNKETIGPMDFKITNFIRCADAIKPWWVTVEYTQSHEMHFFAYLTQKEGVAKYNEMINDKL